MRIILTAVLTGLVLIGVAGRAYAHQSSLTHSDVTVDGADVRYTILITPGDLDVAGGDPVAYVLGHLAIYDGESPCPAEGASLGADGDFTKITFTARCPAAITQLAIEYGLLFEHDATHEAVLRVHAAGEDADAILSADESRFEWDLAEPPPSGAGGFVRSGMDHIFFGFDHVCFLLALLVAIVITRPGDRWMRRGVVETVKHTAVLVTAFTVAHSITLIAASLGVVSLPSRLVESVIALSIAYTAIENIVRPDVRWRYALVFGFGLLHGLGFASMLEVLLPPDDVLVPLLAFNVGVELGQLAIVAVAVPALMMLARALGPDRYRRIALPILSAALAILGLLWLAERVFEVTILGF